MVGNNPIRIYLDNNIYDLILAQSQAFVNSASAKAKFLSCHITEDELMAMPSEMAEKQRALLAVLKQLTDDVPSIPAVWDYGRFDRTLFGDEVSNAIYDSLKEKHDPPDAIHVATADHFDCDYFVTEDRELRLDIERLQLGMKALSFKEMQSLLHREPL